MPHIRLRIDSDFGTLVDEQVDSAIVDRYRELRAQGLRKTELIRALWAEDYGVEPQRAELTGYFADGRTVDIQIP